jgi:hypothetical protein
LSFSDLSGGAAVFAAEMNGKRDSLVSEILRGHCKEKHRSRVGSVRPFGPGTLDEWAKLWHPDIRVTVPEEQPEFLPTEGVLSQ